MTSSNRNISPLLALCGESTWIPLTKASDTELWCFLRSASEQTVEQTMDAGDLRRHRAHSDVTVINHFNE